MRIEGTMHSVPVQGNHSGENIKALRQQLQILEQEYNRLSSKKDLSEAENKRREQLEREIERLRQQLQQMEQRQKKQDPTPNEEAEDEIYIKQSGILV